MGDRQSYEESGRRYVSLAGLRVRGWTGGMVRRLLGAPDRLSVNPRFRDAPHMRLYRMERVEAAERSEGFRAVADSSARRSEAVRAAVRRRREEVMERIRSEPIEVPRLDTGRLALRAVEHRARREMEWNEHRAGDPGSSESRGDHPPGGPWNSPLGTPPDSSSAAPADRSSLAPWKVDYLLHRMSHYDRLLDGLPGLGRGSGRTEALALVRRRICAAIAEAYPDLEQECERRAHEQGLGPPPR
ncbi:hypothetical protein ACWD4G_17045 [Streptomyces sp. NPDC002643]